MHSVVDLQSAMPSTLQGSYSEKGLESNPNNSVHDDYMAVMKTSVQDHKLSAADPVESHVHHGALYRSVKPTQVAVMIQSPSSCLKTFGIEARDLCYKTPNSDGIVGSCMWRKGDGLVDSGSLILKNVNLEAKPGEILAIMGPSGAGKSTLLEVLAGRIRPSSPPHSILINNQTMSVPFFRRISGYVPQDDALFPLLTVKETLTFSANLRLSSSVPQSEKEERVRSLMHELGLMHVADSRIGNEDIRGISGGERRRVSIGVDVIHDPAVLLLDEPTSGLDSAAALHVVEMLHCMAKTRSRTIILSIHQPGFRILQLINSFLLLANGSVAHHGSLERLQNRLVQAGHKIPAQMNVLEFAIDAMASSSGLQLSISPPQPANLTVQLKDLFLPPAVRQDIESGCFHVQVSNDFDAGMLGTKPTFANNSAREIIVLARRFRRNMFRTHELFAARTTQALVAGFALGSLYINSSSNQEGIMMRLGFFAFTLTFLLSATVEALPIFLQERHVLIRETSRGAYRISSYLIANLLVFIPFFLLLALLYSIPVYWLVGLSNASPAFFFFVFVIWLVLLTANSFVAFFSALAPNYIVGNSMISGCMGAFFLFSGYFISEQNMPPYWRFMHYISLFKYPLDALLINEYSSLGGKCLGVQYGDACTLTSDTVLQQLGLKDTCKWQNVAVMIAFTFFYQFLCYIVLRFKVCKRKR